MAIRFNREAWEEHLGRLRDLPERPTRGKMQNELLKRSEGLQFPIYMPNRPAPDDEICFSRNDSGEGDDIDVLIEFHNPRGLVSREFFLKFNIWRHSCDWLQRIDYTYVECSDYSHLFSGEKNPATVVEQRIYGTDNLGRRRSKRGCLKQIVGLNEKIVTENLQITGYEASIQKVFERRDYLSTNEPNNWVECSRNVLVKGKLFSYMPMLVRERDFELAFEMDEPKRWRREREFGVLMSMSSMDAINVLYMGEPQDEVVGVNLQDSMFDGIRIPKSLGEPDRMVF